MHVYSFDQTFYDKIISFVELEYNLTLDLMCILPASYNSADIFEVKINLSKSLHNVTLRMPMYLPRITYVAPI